MNEAVKKPASIRIVDSAKKELMNVSAIDRDGNFLLVKGKIFGTMPMTAKLSPEEARNALKMLTPRLVWFLLTFLFRRSTEDVRTK
ncbi:hypothetical protein [Rhizobium rhizogenes]|uniref:hypothetical protein n=1 Tax=Rhizobium rhizogenes TaxID=359 RepID=UPI00080FFDE5|nr:hypothetical protein [Rhizobium rhizogenes]NTI46254.1 hypothetical protein [Rhizobium rhizogenes]OCJ22095.1 hypothetical protein A6U88_30730 [Agrobacterium sp. B131/95]